VAKIAKIKILMKDFFLGRLGPAQSPGADDFLVRNDAIVLG
jgi:hypothetical protein